MKAASNRKGKLNSDKVFQNTTENCKIILERISDAFVALDKNWNYTFMNKKAGEIFNRDPEQLIGKNIWAEFPEGIGQPFYKAYYKAMAEQKYIYLEEYYPPYDLWFENHIYPSSDGLSIYFRDVTERKKAEEKIKESEERYRSLFENSGEGILLTNPEGQIFSANPEACKLFGRTEEEIRRFGRDGLINLNDPRLPAALEERKRTGKLKSELNFFKKDGTEFTAEINSTVFTNSSGEERTSLFIRDITERKNAELKIKKANERFEMIAGATNDAVFELDLITGESWHNSAFLQLFDSDIAEGNLKPDIELWKSKLHVDDKERVINKLRASFAGTSSKWNDEFRFQKADGTYGIFYDRAFIARDKSGKAIRMMGSMMEITNLKKAKEKTKKMELNYRSIFDQAADTIFLLSPPSKYIDINLSGCLLTGYSKDEFLKLSPIDLVFKEDLKIKPLTDTELKSGKQIYYQRRLKRKDGTGIEVDVSAKMLEDGRVLFFVRDITERKKAEQEIIKTTKDLRILSEHLQNIREEERTGIAREIHDELGQQLTALKMDASWISKKISNNDKTIHEKLSGMLALIDETVKTVRRISSNLRPGILDDLGLIPAIEWLGQEFEKRTGIKVKFFPPFVELDPEKNISTAVFRIYQETLTNIIRHSHATEVETLLEEKAGRIILNIKDNGIGFNLNETKNLTSFGLIGMKERALFLKGELIIKSKKLKGTTIILKIPLLNNDQPT